MGTEQVVESYLRVFSGFKEIAESTRSSARTRLVWFVAIAGFAALNGKPFWDELGRVQFRGILLASLAAPWIVSALLAVITHFVIDEVKVKDDDYYVRKLAAIELHLESEKAGDADPANMVAIINDTHPDLKEASRQNNLWMKRAAWLERVTFGLLILGFIWSLIGPFILRNLAAWNGSA
jgi:hypothetical protein